MLINHCFDISFIRFYSYLSVRANLKGLSKAEKTETREVAKLVSVALVTPASHLTPTAGAVHI